MKYAFTLLIAACLVAPAAPLRADDAPAASDQINKLINQLGAGDYTKREEAAQKLKAIGKPALPALKQAIATTDDAEVSSRAAALVKRIEIRPLPAGNPKNGDFGQITRMHVSVNNGNRILEVTEGGREVKITDGNDSITLSVTGLIDGKPGTEEYTAKDAEQLKEENPEAYALYERLIQGPAGAGMIFGGAGRINGIQMNRVFIQPMPKAPDELELLRTDLEKQMKDAKIRDDQRAEIEKGLNELVDARANGISNIGMEKYTEQCDELRKTLAQYKLDPGEFLPPPAKTRLGVSVSTEEGRLFVQRIADKSRAERIGLRVGDQIRKIDGKELTSVAELRKLVGAKEKGLVVEITRDGDDVKLEEPEEKPAK
jgi:hypothetical protein